MDEGVMEDIRTCIQLGIPKRIPVFALSEEFDVKWHGRYPYEEVCQDGDKMAEVWIAATEEFDYDWVWLQVDDCFEFEPLGVGCYGHGNILRATRDYLPPTQETLRQLKVPDPLKDGRMPEKLKAIRHARRPFGDRACICGGNAAPFSSACLLFGLSEALMMIHTDPDLLKATCDFFVDVQIEWGLAQFEAGALAIWLGDCNAMSHLISAEQYKRFAFEPWAKVIEAYHQAGGLTFLHNSEEAVSHLEIAAQCGASCINVGPGIDIGRAKDILGGRVCLSGNLDPIRVLMNGTPDQVAAETDPKLPIEPPDGSCRGSPPAPRRGSSRLLSIKKMGGLKRSGRRGAPEPRHPSGALALMIISFNIKPSRLTRIPYRQFSDGANPEGRESGWRPHVQHG
ncbi:MAG: uroporphyrinogen decarboxylase family protein [Candidatus Aminicenantales bacterium]